MGVFLLLMFCFKQKHRSLPGDLEINVNFPVVKYNQYFVHCKVQVFAVNKTTSTGMEDYINDTFIRAAERGNLRILKQMLKKGANVNSYDEDGKTAFTLAAEHGHSEAMGVLIEAGADVNKDDSRWDTPLCYAVKNNHVECVSLLIESGADVNKHGSRGKTPLIIASKNGHDEAVRLLVEAGADLNQSDYLWVTALCCAVVNNHVECVSSLIDAGADVNRCSPFRFAVDHNHFEVVSALLKAGADVNQYADVLKYSHTIEMMRLVLRSGAEINRGRWYIWECQYPEKPAMELLVAAGAYLYSSQKKTDDLMGMCREVIREHLLKLDPHTHICSAG